MARLDEELFDPRRQSKEPIAPVRVDLNRYPHYGGRTRVAECSNCGRVLACYQLDAPDEDGEAFCGQCIPEAVDIAYDQYRNAAARRRTDGMWAFIDEGCPERSEGSHVLDGRWNCSLCGIRLYQRRKQAD